MNNTDWTALLDTLPPEQRVGVIQHAIEAQTSVMVASNAILERHEQHAEGIRGQLAQVLGNQPIIADYLKRQEERDKARDLKDAERDKIIGQVVKEVRAIAKQQVAFAKQQAAGARERKNIISRLDQLEAGLEESRQDRHRLDESDKEHAEQLNRIESLLSNLPSPDESADLIKRFKRLEQRMEQDT